MMISSSKFEGYMERVDLNFGYARVIPLHLERLQAKKHNMFQLAFLKNVANTYI